MNSTRIHRVQDSVHGLMEFPGLGAVVIDLLRTPELQRLRRIRQLGLAQLVFPGAEHSRLAHSLGASFLALRFGGRLRESARGYLADFRLPNDESVRDLAIAALCHDLGHGPLSHAWEREIVGEDYDRALWANTLGVKLKAEDNRIKWHELVGQALLLSEQSQLQKYLEDLEGGFSRRIADMLRGIYHHKYLPRLLSSDVDVDRADFLLRDSFQCGVTYGRYDLHWLLSTFTVGHVGPGDYVVGFDSRKSVRAVEEFLLARQAMYETVYHHKTVRSAEGLFALFLRRVRHLAQDGERFTVTEFVQPIVDIIAGKALEPRQLLRLDDFALWVLVELLTENTKDDVLRDLGSRLLSRDLFKRVRVSEERVTDFLTTVGSHQRIYDVLRSSYGLSGEYFLSVDIADFSLFAKKPAEDCYFVDQDRRAHRVRGHEVFKKYDSETPPRRRLFVPKESRDAVEKLITQHRAR